MAEVRDEVVSDGERVLRLLLAPRLDGPRLEAAILVLSGAIERGDDARTSTRGRRHHRGRRHRAGRRPLRSTMIPDRSTAPAHRPEHRSRETS